VTTYRRVPLDDIDLLYRALEHTRDPAFRMFAYAAEGKPVFKEEFFSKESLQGELDLRPEDNGILYSPTA